MSNSLLSQQMQQQSCFNDSLLAQLSQHELDSALETDLQLHEDWLSAHDIEKEQQRLREEEEFKKLQVSLCLFVFFFLSFFLYFFLSFFLSFFLFLSHHINIAIYLNTYIFSWQEFLLSGKKIISNTVCLI